MNKHVYDLLILLLCMSLIISIEEYLPIPVGSYGQILLWSIQNACTSIQPQSFKEAIWKHKPFESVARCGERRQIQEEMLLSLNEAQPKLIYDGKPAKSRGCQLSPGQRQRVCIYSYHNPFYSQLGSKPYLYRSRSQVYQRVTFLGHQDHCCC